MNKIAVQLAPGFEEIEAITIIDVLRRAKLDVTTISMGSDLIVTGSHDIPVVADLLFGEVDYSTIDMIILPGGMPGATNLDMHNGLKKQLFDFNKNNKLLGAICAAPLVLGHLKILEGKDAVCYPGFEGELIGANIKETDIAISENIITGKGVGAALKFALKIVELISGIELADNLKKGMVIE